MTDSIAGLPFWEITFDADGDPDGPGRDAFLAEVPARGITDLFVFSHGWNNERRTARRLYNGFFGLLAAQLRATPADPPVVAGLAGVVWPSKRWSDEPIPDFGPATAAALPGAAAATERAPAPADASSPTLDKQTLDDLRDTFPAATRALDRMAALLETEPDDAALAEFHALLAEFTAASGGAADDGEGDAAAAGPRMLLDGPERLFERYRDALRDAGVALPGGSGGAAGIGDRLRGAWNGAKEALRQATYWEMKNRSGVVGRDGLGPALAALHGAAPGLRVHLIGHSFGARLVSYALAGLPAGRPTSPVKSLTLLQGAFSHFAFADPLPFDAGRRGALAGLQRRVEGPITVCFSRHDGAVGRFYPLASFAAREDSAGANDAMYRWGGMGADGAQNQDAALDAIAPAGSAYRFSADRILNIDAAGVVHRGGAPTGAHSDIVHPELTWVVLAASRA
ncbi:hypothetical protein ACIBSW_40270 [Actinoplanes sp. NPDC049668]|uniref:hypothetical protein n=1 Tax=unclassified Actinoplanes TaxID=2626549 RepID=UPI0033A7CF4A